MAITYNTSGSNSTPANPVAVTPGASAHDVIISAVVTDNTGSNPSNFTHPASFTELAKQVTTADNQQLVAARKKDASGSEGSLSTTISDAINGIGAMACFSGVDNTTSENLTTIVINQNTPQASPLIMSSGSFTPTVNGCAIIAVMGTDVTNSAADSTTTFSTTAGATGAWTTVVDINSGFYNLAIGYAVQTTAGAITIQGSSASSQSAGGALFVIILQPATLSPTINTQPTNQTVFEGNTATFNITATTSGGTLHYQWKFNGSNVGTDTNSYARTNCVYADNGGIVTCDVSDDNGTTTSSNAYLYVLITADVFLLKG